MKTIAFIRRGLTLRIYNMAYALKKLGKYKIVLIIQSMGNDDNLELFKKVFDEIIVYYPLDMHYGYSRERMSWYKYMLSNLFLHFVDSKIKLANERIKISSFFSNRTDIDVYNCLIRPYAISTMALKRTHGHLVFDAYDFNGSYFGIDYISKNIRKIEKNCFDLSDGIMHRGGQYEMDYYGSHGYDVISPDIQWFDYSNKDFFVDADKTKKLSDDDGEYHLVQIGGGVCPKHLDFAKSLVKHHIHYHLYLAPLCMSPMVYKKFLSMEKTGYVHIEKTMPFSKINQEIAKYDYGLHIHLTWMAPMGFKVGHSHKFFNYLESGLPMIFSSCLQLETKTVVENKVGFSVKDEEFSNLRNIIDLYDYDELRKNVLVAREKLLIDNHAERLIEFYNGVIEK